MKKLYSLFVTILLLQGCSSHHVQDRNLSSQNDKPNVILVYTDDLGYSDVSFDHLIPSPTPYLNKLAKNARYYDQFYSASSICSPARASMLSGKFPTRHGVTHAIMTDAGEALDSKEITLGEIFQTAGYRTALFGKWHVGAKKGTLPNDQGFEKFVGLHHSHDLTRTIWDNENKVKDNASVDEILSTIRLEAVDFISGSKKPFFMIYATPMPHVPLPPNTNYQQALYRIDQDMGKMIEALKEQGIYDNTIIMFASDNGPWIPKGDNAGESWPYRGTKGSQLEGGFRVPLLISWPKNITGKKEVHSIVSGTDFFATFVDLLNLDSKKYDLKDSISFLPSIMGENSSKVRKYFYYHKNGQNAAVRAGDWKYYSGSNELYNVSMDTGELTNLAKSYPNIVSKFKSQDYTEIFNLNISADLDQSKLLRSAVINDKSSSIPSSADWNANGKVGQGGIYFSTGGAHFWSVAEDLVYKGSLESLRKALDSGFDVNKKFDRFSRASGTTGVSGDFNSSFLYLASLAGRVDFIEYLKASKIKLDVKQAVKSFKHLPKSNLETSLNKEIQLWDSYANKSGAESSYFEDHLEKLKKIRSILF